MKLENIQGHEALKKKRKKELHLSHFFLHEADFQKSYFRDFHMGSKTRPLVNIIASQQ